jgi:ferredoxin
MKRAICFFTGTGNTYHVALKIQERFPDASLFFIPATDPASLEAFEEIGILSPVYMFGLPEIVREFAKKLAFAPHPRIYAVFTCGGGPGLASGLMKQALKGAGQRLAYWASVTMPDNYILLYKVDKAENRRLLAEAEIGIARILGELEAGTEKKSPPQFFGFLKGIQKLAGRIPHRTAHHYVVDGCLNCGKCLRICPTSNIVTDGHTVYFENRCTGCLGCLHVCPVQAINYRKWTIGKVRYMNPDADPLKIWPKKMNG